MQQCLHSLANDVCLAGALIRNYPINPRQAPSDSVQHCQMTSVLLCYRSCVAIRNGIRLHQFAIGTESLYTVNSFIICA